MSSYGSIEICAGKGGSGSRGWQAPEQLKEGRQTRAVDVFSLGCLFFFCITGGHHPYGEHWLRDANIANGTPDFFLIEEIPEAYYLIKAMLSNDPSKRYISSLCPLRALGFVECRIIIEKHHVWYCVGRRLRMFCSIHSFGVVNSVSHFC
jgi:serine/threonine protein kinase